MPADNENHYADNATPAITGPEETEFQHLLIERRGPIVILTLNRPPLNLLSIDLLVELRMAIRQLGADKSLRCIILAASGKHFCGGADTTTFSIMPRGLNTPFGQMSLDYLELCPLPIIAAIHGACLGGGMELTLACDLRIGTENMKMGVVEGHIGIIPAYGGNTRLPWLIGEANAKKMFYTHARIGGQEALDMGLIQEVCPEEELMDRAMALAEEIAENAPISNREFKRNCYLFRQSLFGGGFLNEQVSANLCSSSQDRIEGWKAFKEKRKPIFQNK